MPFGPDVPLDEVVYFDFCTHVASTGAVSDADSTPTFSVYEEATDTAIISASNATKRTSLTGNYRATFTASAANGFELGKWYSVIVSATVSSIAAKLAVGSFRCGPAEAVAGYNKVDAQYWKGTAIATPTVTGVPIVDTQYFGGTVAATPTTAGIPKTEGQVEFTAGTIADELIAAFGVSGSAASAGASLATTDVDVFNLALDLLKEAPIATATDDTPESRWFLRNYTTARDAELREHPWKFAIKRRTLYATDFVLDGITATLTGAWAPFRLTPKWMGDFVTIRRSSDDTTDDFGLATTTATDGTVTVDDAIALDTSAVSDFIGSGDGYFAGMYDQSGNGNHLAQATSAKQPAYLTDVADNARVTASFDGTNDILSTSAAMSSLMSVSAGYMVIAGLVDALSLDSSTKASNHLLMGDASSKLGLYVRLGGTLYGVNNDGSVVAVSEALRLYVPFVAELRHEDGVVYVRTNGEGEDSATSGDTSSLAGVLNIGDLTGGSQALDFKMFAAMTFSSVPTLAERDRIVSRLMRYTAVPGYDDFGWTYRYPLPADCIRMLQIRLNGDFEGRLIKHELESGYIMTDQQGPLPVRYIGSFSDASKYDPLFKETLAARMAIKLAHWLTGKASMVQVVTDAYNRAMERAMLADSLESTAERPEDSDVIDQRYDAIGVR